MRDSSHPFNHAPFSSVRPFVLSSVRPFVRSSVRPFFLSSFPFDFLSFQLPFNHRTNYLLNQRLFIVFNERGAYLLKLKLTYKAVQIRSKYLWLLMYDLSNHSYDYRQNWTTPSPVIY